MHSDQCGYCRKWVCHKPLLGTLHFCLSPEERARVEEACRAIEVQKQFVARQERLGQPYEKILHDNLWDLYAR